MEYPHVEEAIFVCRPNRFIAQVETARGLEVCHVKNTGRCRELLVPGARVVLAAASNPARKTRCDLVAVYKGDLLINMDSQAPNRVAAEYLPELFPEAVSIRGECRHGGSRLDFLVERPGGRTWVEVKGVTLEREGIALFPDAPTLRGTRHLNELMACVREGDRAMVLFVIQMKGPRLLRPNAATDPAFAAALSQARTLGVVLHAVDCLATPGSLTPGRPVPVEV